MVISHIYPIWGLGDSIWNRHSLPIFLPTTFVKEESTIADAEFLAIIQVLVYVGAVSVVILFGVMLTRRTLRGSTEDV